jgi:hypothetical protein
MPAKARPQTRRLPSGRVQLTYLNRGLGAFKSRTEALDYFDTVVRPALDGKPREPLRCHAPSASGRLPRPSREDGDRPHYSHDARKAEGAA